MFHVILWDLWWLLGIHQHGKLGFLPWVEVFLAGKTVYKWRISKACLITRGIPNFTAALWLFNSLPWKIAHLQMVYLLKMVIFHGYVK